MLWQLPWDDNVSISRIPLSLSSQFQDDGNSSHARCCGSVGLSAFLVFFQKSKDFQRLPNRFPGHLYLQVNQNSLCTEGRKRRKGLAMKAGGLAKLERLQLQVEVILMVELLLETCIVVVCFQASSKRFCQNQLYEIY